MMIVTNKNAFALYMDARFEYGIALDQLKKWRKLNDEYWMKKVILPYYNNALENLSNAMAAYKLTISMDD